VGPSVLIVSEELGFLVECYAGLHRDERIGRIEATTSQDEAMSLVETLHPDAVVFDSSAGGSFGVSSISRLCELNPSLTVVVTFRDRERQVIELTAHGSGARGIFSRDAFSAEALLRAMGPRRAESVAAPA
jgi:DNA-binding NarL/FixJ family response regulator